MMGPGAGSSSAPPAAWWGSSGPGLIDLVNFQMTTFGLGEVNNAVAHAATIGPFRMTVIHP
jgi:hypothetical protein